MARKIPSIQHSWSINDWPAGVYPNDARRARYLLRSNRNELVLQGVLARVGRELIVFGGKYSRWLEQKAANVPGYPCAANTSSACTARTELGDEFTPANP